MLLYSTKVSTSIFCKDTKSNEDNYIIHINFEIILLLFQKFAIFAFLQNDIGQKNDVKKRQENTKPFLNSERIVPVLMQLHGEMVG